MSLLYPYNDEVDTAAPGTLTAESELSMSAFQMLTVSCWHLASGPCGWQNIS